MNKLPVLDKFCVSFDLKTGCVTLGIINAVISMSLATMLVAFATEVKESPDTTSPFKHLDLDEAMANVVYAIILFLAILLFTKMFMDVFLVYAAVKGYRHMISKYCIFWVIFLVLFSIGLLKTLYYMDASHVIAHALFIAENIYYIVVIRSYLITLDDDGVY